MTKNSVFSVTASALAASLLVIPHLAVDTVVAAENKTVTLTCRQNDIILTGMEWSLYKVGYRHGTEIEFVSELSGYSMDLGDLSAETVDTAAKTIESYVVASGVAPIGQGSTDGSGILGFSGLDNGLYLAVGKVLQVGETWYFPSTLLVEINNSDTGLDYDAYPKFYYKVIGDEVMSYTVKKVWEDNDNAAGKRPDSITVDLFKDGCLDDTVILSEDNGWKYSWESLEAESEWLAAERDIPDFYEVMIDHNTSQYLIKNSYIEETVVTTTVTKVSNTDTSTFSTTTYTTATTAQTTVTTEKLAQTGQLWWPVLPLSFGGVFMIGTGLSMRKRKKKNEK